MNDCLFLKKYIPMEFSRKPRYHSEFDKWKATEIRLLLMYIGKIILKVIIDKVYYDNVLILSTALSTLVSADLVNSIENIEIARCMLRLLVKESIENAFAVYNVHILLHLHEDALLYGSLDNCSCFVFENYLHKLKLCIKSGKNTFIELTNKIWEHMHITIEYKDNLFVNKKRIY